jgi:hypothetical protein
MGFGPSGFNMGVLLKKFWIATGPFRSSPSGNRIGVKEKLIP